MCKDDSVSFVRVIARLDIKGDNVIKGIHLEGLRVVGQPDDLAQKYYKQGADELIYMDAVASLYERNNILPIVKKAAQNIFIPMTVGGGIRNLENIREVLRHGADKVAVNTAAVNQPKFINDAANMFGSQCIVLSVEAIRREQGMWEVLVDNGREPTGRNVFDWVEEAEERGVGEILVTSVDAEGTEDGFDIELTNAIATKVKVPIIASGGAGEPKHIHSLIEQTDINAFACASILHYNKYSLLDLKLALNDCGLSVRL